ncbi:MAG TPA: tetraacyldisaccharide 4'-kinase [Candidatus Krumholzibacteria bacterium]|nr:tetraacyldisaccharide 4'-kinase [Candidatus Krumholzibacteria bacterium]
MTILDLRPWYVRAWSRRQPGAEPPRGIAAWATALADRAIARRVAARPAPPPGLGVVSVGNLALGGTGKTPVAIALAQGLAAAGWSGAVLTRGYGSRQPGPLTVAPDDPQAADEARLMAAALAGTGWFVLQARRRAAGLDHLAGRLPRGSVILLEDGHQTAGVGRHLDVVILDAWRESPGLVACTGPVAPFGSWRESAAGAARAAVWLVESPAPPVAPTGGPAAVVGFVRTVRLADPSGHACRPAGPWAALSGIAHPVRFETGAAGIIGAAPTLAVRCADHEPYAPARLARITAAIRASGAALTVTTEKDWVKLQGRWPADLPVAVARLDVAWTGGQALPALVGERLAAIGLAAERSG